MTATERYFQQDTNWVLAEHITTPRRSWRDAENGRTRAPAPMPQDIPAAANTRSKPSAYTPIADRPRSHYTNVFMNNYGRWRCTFSYEGRKRNVPGTYATDHDAADAYNAYLEAHQIDRDRLVVVR